MKFIHWLRAIIEDGFICDNYVGKLDNVVCKREIMDIVLDANGVSFLLDMEEAGHGLPYDTVVKEFGGYINGRYKAEFKKKNKNGYSSKIYCCYTESSEIEIDTTATVLLGCNNDIRIKPNDYVKLYVDCNCDININCPKSSQCIVEFSKGALIGVSRNEPNVKLVERKNG